MEQKRILYVENDSNFLDTRSEFLRLAGYHVIKAHSPEEAREALERENIHLTVLDLRLVDDNDEEDISGFILAQNERYQRIPKIFVTGYPTYEVARDALGPKIGGKSIAYAFLAKKEGHQAFIQRVHSAFEEVVGINWDLEIEWDETNTLSFPYLALLLEKELEPALLQARSGELSDLFRKLFSKEEHIAIHRLNWQNNGCACLTLYAQKNDSSRQVIVIFGLWEIVQRQYKQIKQYLNVEPVLFAEPSLVDSLHYAAFAWTVPGAGINPLQSGLIFFENAADKLVRTALENLFGQNLHKWYQHERTEINDMDLAGIYHDRLDIISEPESSKLIRKIIGELASRAQAQGLAKEIFLKDDELGIILNNDQVYRGPDPIPALFNTQMFEKQSVTVASNFGGITSRSLLVDQEANIFPTDFSNITRSPILEDFISLECEFHFDRIGFTDLLSLLDFETQIGEGKTLSGIPAGISVEPECRRALTIIQSIRKLAAEETGNSLDPYLIGLFHYIMKPLLDLDTTKRYAKHQTLRLVHRLMAASMIINTINRLGNESQDQGADQAKSSGLVLDINSHIVTIDGKEIHLTQTEFRLLSYLYEHRNNLCKRDDILSSVFEIKGKPSDADKSLLNTHIDRLRGKIDLNPGKHRYIVNIRGEGYRLDLES